MRNRISLTIAALLRGMPPNRIRQQLHQVPALRQLGEKEGRELLLDLSGFTLFFAAGEFRHSGRSLSAGLEEARALGPALVDWANARPAPEFAVLASGSDPGMPPQRFSCKDADELADAVRKLAAAGAVHLTVVNLRELVLDIFAAWQVAIGNADGYLAQMRASAPPEDFEDIAARVALFQARLGQSGSAARTTDNGTLVLDCAEAPAAPADELRVPAQAASRAKAWPQ